MSRPDDVAELTSPATASQSHPNVNVEAVPLVDLFALARAHEDDDAELRGVLDGQTALQLARVVIPGSDVSIYCDTATGRTRPFVPASQRRNVFNALHGLSHPGVRPTCRMVSHRFVWSFMQRDCQTWTRAYALPKGKSHPSLVISFG